MPIRTHRFINFERSAHALATSLHKNINHLRSHLDELLTAGHITTDEYLVLTHRWTSVSIQNDFLTAVMIQNIRDLRAALTKLCGWQSSGYGVLRIAEFSMLAHMAMGGADFQIRPLLSSSRTAHRLIDFAIRVPLYWQEREHNSEHDFEETRQFPLLDQVNAIPAICPPDCPYFRPPFDRLENHVHRTMRSWQGDMPDVYTGSAPFELYRIPNLFNTGPIEDLLGLPESTVEAIFNSARTYLDGRIATARPAPPAKLPFEPTDPTEDETLDGLLAVIDKLTKVSNRTILELKHAKRRQDAMR